MSGLEKESFFVSGHEFIGIGNEGKHSPTCKLCAEMEAAKATANHHDPNTCALCHWTIPGHNPETCDLCKS